MKYQLVDPWKKKANIVQLCRLLDVSRSGYYAAKVREKLDVICPVSVHVKAAFNQSGKSYGSRRLVSALHAKGIMIGRYKVRSLMRQSRLVQYGSENL